MGMSNQIRGNVIFIRLPTFLSTRESLGSEAVDCLNSYVHKHPEGRRREERVEQGGSISWRDAFVRLAESLGKEYSRRCEISFFVSDIDATFPL